MKRVISHIAFAAITLALCGWIPGPQGSGGGSFSGGTLDSQVAWATGAGSIWHLQGPTDQPFGIQSGSGQDLILGTTATAALTIDTSQGATFAGHIVQAATKDLYVGSTLYAPGDMTHAGDTDTKISFATDEISLYAGNVAMLTLTESTTDTATFGAQVTWADSLGAITHLLGPSDQDFALQGGSGRGVSIYSNATNTYGFYAAPSAAYIRSDGDWAITCAASQLTTFHGVTNFTQTAAADSTTPTLINLPTGGTAAQAGWVAIQVNGSTAWIPYWQ